jgi:hypothetical protein
MALQKQKAVEHGIRQESYVELVMIKPYLGHEVIHKRFLPLGPSELSNQLETALPRSDP